MAESAINLAKDYLAPLLVQEAKLLVGIHNKVESIQSELEFIQSFLKDADLKAEKGDTSSVTQTWVKNVRETAYHIEDVIDEYLFHFAKYPQTQRRVYRIPLKIFQCVANLKPRHVITSKIQDINDELKALRERGERFGFNNLEQGGLSNDARQPRCDLWNDPREASLFIADDELVGIEGPKDKLIKLLVNGPSNLMVISVVGIGGLGKTTLVKKVYENEQVTLPFHCSAWITVSQSYKMEEILRKMIKDFYKARKGIPPREIDTMERTMLIQELRQFLLELRYVVVFDDVWDMSFWRIVQLALPDKNKGSRIVITTRDESVVPSDKQSPFYHVYKLSHLSLEKAQELFCKKVFQCEGRICPRELNESSNSIIKRCGGLPLAIVTIGGLLSTKQKVESEWIKFLDSLTSELESNPQLQDITKILSLSYIDLPYNLKACFLYFGMFPEDYFINSAKLIRLWIAEGFVKEMSGKTLEDIAQDYLNQLIHRCLVQVARIDFNGRTRSCRVHDMLHGFILTKSKELSFHWVSIQNCLRVERIARRLSIQTNVNTPLQSITSSQTRSILILGLDEVPNSFLMTCFSNFKLMKVMDFEGAPIDCIPKEVGSLFHLRYLSLRDTEVQMLPKSIGKLLNLETLDLKRSLVSELPAEISGLLKLRYLVAYNYNGDTKYNIDSRCGIKIPNGIRHLESLQKLYEIEATSATLITELGSLAQLRKLSISKLKKENGMDLCTAIQKMGHLRSLEISATSEEEVLNLQSLPSPPLLLQTLCLHGRLEKLPEWIPKLKSILRIDLCWSRLMEDPLKFLQSLPNLMTLSLCDGYRGEQLHIEGRSFQKLKELRFLNFGGLNRLIIDEGALPLLERLQIGECPQLKEVPSGIHHLKSLKKLEFSEMPTEFVLSLQPDEGPDFGKVKHIPSVTFWYRTQGENYTSYTLGNSALLKRLRS
ncbi:disease resistance protein RPM1-like isoform X9 [Quercus robur]|uniref:disease resistance protein RPM1-like isoform X9 n=1 Tax=Quercus robur TaxID=38942 RepID=UPI00216354B8|nr:disease resistance protein RPM1-like isoform X9 [Quercus robur]